MATGDTAKRKVRVAPSLLSADFANLGAEIKKAEAAGADMLHLDVMDGHFVPNITFGPAMVKSIRRVSKLPLDVHLMIEHPDSFIARFAEAGADFLTVHAETCRHLNRTISAIKEMGVKAGVSLNPHNPPLLLSQVIGDVDLILLMSVNPGFGGQIFIENTISKIIAVKNLIEEYQGNCLIEVDGGINDKTGIRCVEAGADILVAGNYLFNSSDFKKAIDSLRF